MEAHQLSAFILAANIYKMRVIVFTTFMLGFLVSRSQSFSKLFDSGVEAFDTGTSIVVDNDNLLLSYRIIGDRIGGYSINKVDRVNGVVRGDIKYLVVDSFFSDTKLAMLGDSIVVVVGTVYAWPDLTTVGSVFFHFYDKNLGLIKRVSHPPISSGLDLRDLCLDSEGFLATFIVTISSITSSLAIHYDFNGVEQWRKELLPELNNLGPPLCVTLRDTLCIVGTQITAGIHSIHILKYNLEGDLLQHQINTDITRMLVGDLVVSPDSTELLLTGYQTPDGSSTGYSRAAFLILDRSFATKALRVINTPEKVMNRTGAYMNDGKILLGGHGIISDVNGTDDHACVMLINREDLGVWGIYYYSPSGNLADGKVKIMNRSTATGSQFFLAGHGGITDATNLQDAWLLALNADGTCDTASCWPWLVSGISGLDASLLASFNSAFSGAHLTVQLEDAALLSGDPELEVLGLDGRVYARRALRDLREELDAGGWPSGWYVVRYRSQQGDMLRRVFKP